LTRASYKQFKELADEFGDDLVLIAFPTGEFGGQELPTDADIAKFAYDRVKFPKAPQGVLLTKADLADRASWQAMQSEAGANAPDWNFQGKFLVSRDGAVTDASGVADVASAIKGML